MKEIFLRTVMSIYQYIQSHIDVNDYEYRYMDKLAIEAGTDKSSKHHDYTKVYAKYFAPLKEKDINFLEIGILFGESVKLWEAYFSHAKLHFIDKDEKQIQYKSIRSNYQFLDQADADALTIFANKFGNFDVIIDDGGHMMAQQIISFITLFPYLNSQGIYIIEDLHTSYSVTYGGHGTLQKPLSGPGTTVTLLKSLIDELNYPAARTWKANLDNVPEEFKKSLTSYQKDILGIHFYQSLCIIIKR